MITVEGSIRKWEQGLTLEQVVAEITHTYPFFIVKLNNSIVHRKGWKACIVPDGSSVDIYPIGAGG